MRVLVTGGAGYIGSHVVWTLLERGHEAIVLDNLSTGKKENLPENVTFYEGDIGDPTFLINVFKREKIDAVMHFAGLIVVPESIDNPIDYYRANCSYTLELIRQCIDANVKKFIFSSTAAVYGMPERIPVTEDMVTQPINPYGWSKLMVEQYLHDTAFAHDFNYIALRYFNVAGADPQGRTGQSTPNATHLIKIACETALAKRDKMYVYGDDYKTPDGTCVRDYIHVSDLAEAHAQALDYLEKSDESHVFNCGYGHGFSVKEVLSSVEKVHGATLNVEQGERRAGDSDALVANSDALRTALGWVPKYDNLDFIVKTALEWERKP